MQTLDTQTYVYVNICKYMIFFKSFLSLDVSHICMLYLLCAWFYKIRITYVRT